MSWLAGIELYRNQGNGPFSKGYDLLKTGLTFEFPLLSRWETGGELIYGYGFDSSTKYEISGHIHYFLLEEWTFGVGYRLHLFQAGSEATTPYGLPYREGFGEGYSAVKWHY